MIVDTSRPSPTVHITYKAVAARNSARHCADRSAHALSRAMGPVESDYCKPALNSQVKPHYGYSLASIA